MRRYLLSPFLPIVLYLIAFAADSTITSYGINSGLAGEGNEIVVWLWGIFGRDAFSLKILYIVFVVVLTLLLWKLNKWLGLWLIYSFTIGHALGFITWVTPIRVNTYEIIIIPMILSIILLFILKFTFSKIRSRI